MRSVLVVIKGCVIFVLVVCFLGMSTQHSASGRLALVGNEPFTYLVLKCDDGSKLRLSQTKPEWMTLQGQMVELVYTDTDEENMLPIVKVITLRKK